MIIRTDCILFLFMVFLDVCNGTVNGFVMEILVIYEYWMINVHRIDRMKDTI
jgi:hypothetical protein